MWVIGSRKGTGLREVGWEDMWGGRGGRGGGGWEGREVWGELWGRGATGRRRDNIVQPGNRGTRGTEGFERIRCFRICNSKKGAENGHTPRTTFIRI